MVTFVSLRGNEFIQYKKGCSNISTQYENVKNGKETITLGSGHN